MSIQGIEIGVDWDRADTSKQHALGTQLPRVGGFVMRYVEAGEALVAGNAVTIDYAEGVDVYEHTDAVAEQVHGVVGKALADGEFGWIGRRMARAFNDSFGVVIRSYRMLCFKK